MRKALHVTLVILCGLGAAVYVAAKIDFFVHYSPSNLGGYLSQHYRYWAAIAVISGVVWLIEKLLIKER